MTYNRLIGVAGALVLSIAAVGAHTTATDASTPSRVTATTKTPVSGLGMLDAIAFRTAQRGWVGGAHTSLRAR